MEGVPPTPAQGPPPMRGGFRGRGGPPMRGYDRGRGRGMGRGGLMMGSRGMGGPPMMRGRGMMRGGPPRGMGFQRGCPPRGMPMRGGRPPMHVQQQNLTSPPTQPQSENSTSTSAAASSATTTATTTTTAQTSVTGGSSVPSSRGAPRGRGSGGRGRGSYIPSTNGTVSISHDPSKPPPMGKPYRGGPPRGRGYISQGMSRPPPPHSANTQVTTVPTLKRGAPTGPPGPKRGRYDQAPVNRQLVPKHHPQVQAVHPAPHGGYANSSLQSYNHHGGYQGHEQMQTVDQYSQQAYAAPPPQNAYNGYAQGSYGTATSGYAQTNEYDQSQYQSYSTSAYNQQDTRYQGYTQDYSQTYGAPAVDYTAPPPDYSQQTQAYDDRSYAGYDTQAYSQGYTNAAGYY